MRALLLSILVSFNLAACVAGDNESDDGLGSISAGQVDDMPEMEGVEMPAKVPALQNLGDAVNTGAQIEQAQSPHAQPTGQLPTFDQAQPSQAQPTGQLPTFEQAQPAPRPVPTGDLPTYEQTQAQPHPVPTGDLPTFEQTKVAKPSLPPLEQDRLDQLDVDNIDQLPELQPAP